MKPRTRHILACVGYPVNILTALATICAAYGGMVNPDVATLPAMLAMTFPFWLILSVLLVIADLLTLKPMAIAPAVGLFISIGPMMSYAPVNFVKERQVAADEAGARTFKVLSYNVAGLYVYSPGDDPADKYLKPGAPLNEIVDYMIHSGADIILTQECPVFAPHNHLGFTREQIDTMCRLYPHRLMPLREEDFRSKIFSKYPLYPVDLPMRNGTAEWSAAMVDIQGHKTLVIDVHLQSIGLSPEDKALYKELTEGEGKGKIETVRRTLLSKLSQAFRERARQARTLRHVIDSVGAENVILAGDFNDIPDCYAIREICGNDFHNAFTEAGNGPMITFHSDRFYFHIDHILYRGDMEAIDFKRGECAMSDHYPVMATFLWRPDRPGENRNPHGLDLINRPE